MDADPARDKAPTGDRPVRTSLWKRIALFVASIVVALIAGELVFRVVDATPPFPVAKSLEVLQPGQKMRHFDLDPVLGYRPRLGPSNPYDERGLRRPAPGSEKEGAGRRVLFLGDSVAAHGQLIKGIRNAYADQPIDALNAGIDGYNVVQERLYYEQHFTELPVTQVVLVLHANDLTNSLMLYPTDQGYLFWYFFGVEPVVVNPTMLKWSYIYRRYLMVKWKTTTERVNKDPRLFAETEKSFGELAAALGRRGVPFRVIMFPLLLPFDSWDGATRARWQRLKVVFDELKVEYTDLYPVVAAALPEGRIPANAEAAWKSGFDYWHPDQPMADRMGALIRTEGLLDP